MTKVLEVSFPFCHTPHTLPFIDLSSEDLGLELFSRLAELFSLRVSVLPLATVQTLGFWFVVSPRLTQQSEKCSLPGIQGSFYSIF